MKKPVNLKTKLAIDDYLSKPGQAVGLIGQKWLNKGELALELAEELLVLKEGQLESYPYKLIIDSSNASSITIDQIRSITDFTLLKVPSKKAISRIVIIPEANKMTLEAQNALLKSLEEPPLDCVFILTSQTINELLPTMVSRLKMINVSKPSKEELTTYFSRLGYQADDIKQAILIADGLPGLAELLLKDKTNPFNEALTTARKLLSATTFERLSLINDLSKDKSQVKNIFFIIKQMAKIGVGSNNSKSSKRWQRILKETLKSEGQLKANVQLKLLLTDYLLSIS